MGGDQGDRAGGLVDLAGLDADEAVLDHVEAAHALGAGPLVELLDGLQHRHLAAVDRDRDAGLEGDDDGVGLTRGGRVLGVLVDVLDRGVPDVLQEARLDGATEDVLVDRVRVLLGGHDREVLGLGEGNRLVAGHRVVADRGDALQLGGQRLDADLEADLVVALAGAAVGDDAGAVLLRGGDQVLDDRRAGERRDQRVLALVEGVGLDRRQAVLVRELLAGVGHLGLDGAAVQRPLADGVQVLAALADVDRDGDDLGAGLLGDPADADGRVQTARIGEYDAFGHGFLLHKNGMRTGRRAGVPHALLGISMHQSVWNSKPDRGRARSRPVRTGSRRAASDGRPGPARRPGRG